ncbi:sel1 repeat family protein [Mesorhizobium sp. M2A.F.Ca.ET.029.05.1.1]|uniref:tetratricopeptide repeat protein n=1 Tax=Mesorhizobium sp. M2A.F.Ca.ET.029.05.1.1 TaxID=2496658 RepID=UPI000FD52F72|nr:tetratricopeptide repeat protein [Mesorhizobium sp. M2A.F.Ca.ET.029.05.1.1]RVD11957.1 sel1 repeat family protein [Mesorhizobium sp. M2A.F.Ca.ET.029.05.1.1]
MAILDRLTGRFRPALALRRAIQLSDSGRLAEAFALMAIAAGAGIVEAQYRVGRCYLEGTGVPPSHSEGARWLRRAANRGSPDAQALLAALCIAGLAGKESGSEGLFERDSSREPDFTAALELARKASEAGSATGQALIGYILSKGPKAMRDLDAAHGWYEKSAAAGCPEGCLGFALSLARLRQPEQRARIAAEVRRAADAGHQPAARALASLYLSGNGVAKDAEEGARLLRAAAASGNRESQVDLANLVLDGGGEPDDEISVAGWFGASASSGDLVAAFNLGLCFANGLGVRKDQERAAHWIARAAEGVAEAQYMYARMLQDGRGMAADQREARLWFERAAGAGIVDAQVALAEMLYNGRGGERSLIAAAHLFKQAAAAGHAGAMFAIGALYETGQGVSLDYKAAQKWFAAAAERGHGHAQLMLGRYLSRGIAGDQDPAAARIWLERAAARGVEEASDELAETERRHRSRPLAPGLGA